MDLDLKMIFMLMTRRATSMSRYVANPIPTPCKKITIMASRLLTTLVRVLQLLTMLFHFLQAHYTLLLLLADFHPLLCFKKVETSPLGRLQPPRSLPLPLAHSLHRRDHRESVHVRRSLLMKTELRPRSSPPLQLKNMLGRWQSIHNGWLSWVSRSSA